MNSNQLTEAIERYLNGEMDEQELNSFEQMRRTDPGLEIKIAEHRQFAATLHQYRERLELESRLNAIHDEMDVHALVEEMTVHPAWIVRMWRNHHSKISVAASVAIFAVLTTMFFTGYFKRSEPEYKELSKKIDQLHQRTIDINNELHRLPAPRKHMQEGNYQGTGFALSSNGYIVTNNHVIGSKYDSIYVQNADGDAFKAKVVYTEPMYDIAILKITDKSFTNLPALPYSFKHYKGDMGENVYTMGYSEGDSPVMDKGYISSVNGFRGDSAKYRISIPVNPGNSGGPLLNSNGSVIGIVAGKQTQTEGASYAIKTDFLLKAIKNDTLANKLSLNNKNMLAGQSFVKQTGKLQNFVFMVKVY